MSRRLAVLALPIVMLAASRPSVADEPDVRVARVSYTGGEVSYERGDSDGWNALVPNTPLVPGDSIYTADDGRAEVHFGNGSVFRMDAGTQVDLVAGTQDLAQLGVRSGYVNLRAATLPSGATLEVDTPSGAATVLTPGVYRFEVTGDGARYSVVKGHLSVALRGQQLDVDAGERLNIQGADDPSYAFDHVDPENALDRWAHDRDLRAQRSISAHYVHPDVVGSEDLDDHGTWRQTPEYGRVWTPSGVPDGWAPYQAGRWIWQDPYGWTWVSDESWGWAPYHYGRWVFTANAWGWVPPPAIGFQGPSFAAEIRPCYAPALVAFVGGSNWSLGVSLGGAPSIGWVPLAPREHYYYPWQPAPRVTNNYTNITVVNAVTVVNTTTFASGPVHPIHVPHGQIVRAPVIGYTANTIVPTRQSLCVSRARDPHSRYVPRQEFERPLVVRVPPPPRPMRFDDKVSEIHRTGRPFEGHDRGEHIAVVSAADHDPRRELTARPGTVNKHPRPIDRDLPLNAHSERPADRPDHRAGPREATMDPRNNAPHGPSPKWEHPAQTTERVGESQRTYVPPSPRWASEAPHAQPAERAPHAEFPDYGRHADAAPDQRHERTSPAPRAAENEQTPHAEPPMHGRHTDAAPEPRREMTSPTPRAAETEQAPHAAPPNHGNHREMAAPGPMNHANHSEPVAPAQRAEPAAPAPHAAMAPKPSAPQVPRAQQTSPKGAASKKNEKDKGNDKGEEEHGHEK